LNVTATNFSDSEAPGAAAKFTDLLTAENRILRMIAERVSLRTVLEALARLAERHGSPGLFSSILLLDKSGFRLMHGAAPSLPDAYNRAIDGLSIGPSVGSCGTAAFRKERVVVTDVSTDPLWAEFRDLTAQHGLRACWSTPILSSRGSVLGTFALYYREPGEPRPEDLAIIDTLTSTAALAIQHDQAQHEIVANEERLRSLSRCSPLGIFSTDVDGAFAYVNPRFRELGGYDFEKTVGYWLANVLPPGETRALADQWSGQTLRRAEISDEFAVIVNGAQRWVHLRASPMTSSTGEYMGYAGTLEDVTERKLAEAQLQRSQARLSLALEAGKMGAWEWNIADGTVVWSAQLEAIHGMPRGSFGGTFEDFLADMNPEHRSSVIAEVEAALRDKQDYAVEYEIIRPDGTHAWLEAHGKVLLDPAGNVTGMAGVCMDITERHRNR
jgi:PAS domain S-box-containing protein